MATRRLRIIKIDGVDYFVDKRLSEIREIGNPHNRETVSPEVINYWIAHDITEI